MASKATENVFNINNIKSAKKLLEICPKFLDYMIINGETNAAIRGHPGVFHLPSIKLPDRIDKAVAKYLRDEVITEPRDLHTLSYGLNKALASRNLILEKDLKEHLRKNFRKRMAFAPDLDLPDDVSKYLEESEDPATEEMLMLNATNIARMQNERLESIARDEVEDLTLPPIYSQGLCNIYLVARLAPNFAATCRVLYEIRKRCPGFSPETLFDFGSGLGTATWSANSVWPINTIKEHFLVDASTKFLEISEYLLKDGFIKQHNMAFSGITFRSYLPATIDRFYDIVVSSYGLLDISGGYLNRREIISSLWKRTNKFLVLVDYGTKGGFQAILEARDWLMTSTKDDEYPAQLFAPCPHTMTCPKADSACTFITKYFKLRLTESRDTVRTESFSYVIFHKGDISQYQDGFEEVLKNYSRNVSYKVNGNVQDLCTKDGDVSRYYIDMNERAMKRYLKRCQPGDLMPLMTITGTHNDGDDSEDDSE